MANEKLKLGYQVVSEKEANAEKKCCFCDTQGNLKVFPVWTSGPWRNPNIKVVRPDPIKTLDMCVAHFNEWSKLRDEAFEKIKHPKWNLNNQKTCCVCNDRKKNTRTTWIRGVHKVSTNQIPYSVPMCEQCEADWEGKKEIILKAMYISSKHS